MAKNSENKKKNKTTKRRRIKKSRSRKQKKKVIEKIIGKMFETEQGRRKTRRKE